MRGIDVDLPAFELHRHFAAERLTEAQHLDLIVEVAAVLIAVAVSIQKFFAEAYNNYLVFTGSLKVLLAHGALYAPHPEHYGDLFKYSPTFPLFMLPFLPLPLLLGIICWNAANALALYAAIRRVWPDDRRVVIALLHRRAQSRII